MRLHEPRARNSDFSCRWLSSSNQCPLRTALLPVLDVDCIISALSECAVCIGETPEVVRQQRNDKNLGSVLLQPSQNRWSVH